MHPIIYSTMKSNLKSCFYRNTSFNLNVILFSSSKSCLVYIGITDVLRQEVAGRSAKILWLVICRAGESGVKTQKLCGR